MFSTMSFEPPNINSQRNIFKLSLPCMTDRYHVCYSILIIKALEVSAIYFFYFVTQIRCIKIFFLLARMCLVRCTRDQRRQYIPEKTIQGDKIIFEVFEFSNKSIIYDMRLQEVMLWAPVWVPISLMFSTLMEKRDEHVKADALFLVQAHFFVYWPSLPRSANDFVKIAGQESRVRIADKSEADIVL